MRSSDDPKAPRALPAACLCLALAAGGAGASEERPGRLRTFLDEHGWRLLGALALQEAAGAYDATFGPSHQSLLFPSLPPLDRHVHETFAGPSRPRNYLEDHGLETLRYGVPLALIGVNLRDGRAMARDLLGFVETFWANRGLTSLLKDVAGRERPALELASGGSASPARFADLDADEGNHESFPSGHASGSFAFASYLERALARKIGLGSPWRAVPFAALYGAAGYIGYSRIHRGKHFFTDVAAGAALGVSVSRTYYRWNHPEEFASPAGRAGIGRRVRLLPPAPVPGGAAVMVGVDLDGPRP